MLANWHNLVLMKAIPNGIPGVIEAAAKERGLSLAALAAKTRMSYDSVLRKVRRRERSISMEDLQEFADALEVPGSELIRRAEEHALAAAQGEVAR